MPYWHLNCLYKFDYIFFSFCLFQFHFLILHRIIFTIYSAFLNSFRMRLTELDFPSRFSVFFFYFLCFSLNLIAFKCLNIFTIYLHYYLNKMLFIYPHKMIYKTFTHQLEREKLETQDTERRMCLFWFCDDFGNVLWLNDINWKLF